MKMVLLLATLAPLLTACGIGGCYAGPGEAEVSLYVTDAATGAAVRNPAFRLGGQEVDGVCQGPSASDPLVCESWVLIGAPAKQTIWVTAAGYKAAMLDVDTTTTMSIHLGVELEAL